MSELKLQQKNENEISLMSLRFYSRFTEKTDTFDRSTSFRSTKVKVDHLLSIGSLGTFGLFQVSKTTSKNEKNYYNNSNHED